MRRSAEWIALVLILGAFLLLNAQLVRDRAGDEHFPPFTTFSRSPTGMRGLLTLSERMGLRAGQWRRAYDQLNASIGVLWLIPPTTPPVDAGLRRWVENGGTLIYQGPARFAPFVPAEADGPETAGSVSRRIARIDPNVIENRGIAIDVDGDPVVARDVRRLWSTPARRTALGTPLIRDANGALVVAHRVGAGQVIVVVDNTLFLNRALAREDNAVLAANLLFRYAGGKRVLFDEVVHGFAAADRSRWDELLENVRGWAYAQVAFAAALLLLSAGWRMGPPVPLPETERTRYAVEYAVSMANLHRRAGARQRGAAMVHERWRREVLPRLGLTASADAEAITSRLSDAGAEAFRNAAALLGSGLKTDADLVRLGRDLETARRAALGKDA